MTTNITGLHVLSILRNSLRDLVAIQGRPNQSRELSTLVNLRDLVRLSGSQRQSFRSYEYAGRNAIARFCGALASLFAITTSCHLARWSGPWLVDYPRVRSVSRVEYFLECDRNTGDTGFSADAEPCRIDMDQNILV